MQISTAKRNVNMASPSNIIEEFVLIYCTIGIPQVDQDSDSQANYDVPFLVKTMRPVFCIDKS